MGPGSPERRHLHCDGSVTFVGVSALRRWHRNIDERLYRSLPCLPYGHLPDLAADAAERGHQWTLDIGGREGDRVTSLTEHVVVLDLEPFGANVVGDAVGRLPFRCAAFDAVATLEVLEHVTNPAEFLAEARRVVRTGGSIYLSTRQAWRAHGSPNDYFRYTRDGLRLLLSGAGFRSETERPLGGPFTVMAVTWDQLVGQTGLSRFRSMLVWPVWFVAIRADRWAMRQPFFEEEPDTSGWLVVARAV